MQTADVCPALAGVIPAFVAGLVTYFGMPRTGGGDPQLPETVEEIMAYAPHWRG